MRPIRFRAWDKFDSKMIEWTSNVIPAGVRYELMQFTGLLDKNGKEIYEGDILAYAQMGLQKDECGDVRFHKGSFVIWMSEKLAESVDTRDSFISIMNCDVYAVIGNIHENPVRKE
jgi:uncharacterized phage protein (TIGR01671 family)